MLLNVPIPFFYQFRHLMNEMPYVHYALCVETCPADNPDWIALMVASNIIGNYDKSMGMAKNASNKFIHGCYNKPGVQKVQSFMTMYKDTGLW